MNPLIALQLAKSFAEAGSSIAQFMGQSKASKANEKNANNAYFQTLSALNLRGAQETNSAQQTIMQQDREARSQDALARVSAGESGVAGASVDALLSDITAQGLNAKLTTQRNLDNTLGQIRLDKLGALSERNSRIAAVPRPSPFMLAAQIGGSIFDAAGDYMHSKPAAK